MRGKSVENQTSGQNEHDGVKDQLKKHPKRAGRRWCGSRHGFPVEGQIGTGGDGNVCANGVGDGHTPPVEFLVFFVEAMVYVPLNGSWFRYGILEFDGVGQRVSAQWKAPKSRREKNQKRFHPRRPCRTRNHSMGKTVRTHPKLVDQPQWNHLGSGLRPPPSRTSLEC